MITLNTIIYEGNFDKILTNSSWFFTFNSNMISKKMLTVNNITSIDRFNESILELKKIHDFDVIFVDEHVDEIKHKFNLNIDKNTIGYYYTIPYFVAIANITTNFILNVASDCMDDIFIDDEFLIASLNELQNNPLCSTAMVAWTKNNYIMANGKTVGEHEEIETFRILRREKISNDKYNYTANFTDQLFIGLVDKLKKINYNLPESTNFYKGPAYGGNSFEKRMVTNQIHNNIYNCVFKGNQYYIHDKNYY